MRKQLKSPYTNMRIGIAVDYGKYANASSLNLIARKIFSELGKLMNQRKDFTIAALIYENIGIGNVNQHYDCISIPNIGGYKFPHSRTLSSKKLVIGLSGIDEVVLGEKVYKTRREWETNKILIEREVPKWEKYSNLIRLIHVPSNSDKSQMIQYLKIHEGKIHVIYHGVEHERFRPPIDKEKERKRILGSFFMRDSPYFIHISESNWARKNIFRMLEAFDKARKGGIVHKLVIVGKTDDIVYQKASSIDGVKILGYVSQDNLVRLLQCADAMVFPSLHEGFGLPIAESMACGVPVITSNVFSPPEIVGDSGLLVDPYDISDITSKIVEMSSNEPLREKLSQRAIELSMKYSWQDAAAKLLELVEQDATPSSNFDFEKNYELSAYRTLTTMCQMNPQLYSTSVQDLLEFDYSRIIQWAVDAGLEDPNFKDYLIPFREWLLSHS